MHNLVCPPPPPRFLDNNFKKALGGGGGGFSQHPKISYSSRGVGVRKSDLGVHAVVALQFGARCQPYKIVCVTFVGLGQQCILE